MGDKIIVMASLESEDTSWMAEKLTEYAALNEASPTQGAPLANLAVTSQLAARDISRQPFQSFRSFIPQTYYTGKQGPRGDGLLDVHYRSLQHLSSVRHGVYSCPPTGLLPGVAC
jgi:hypothetical protein